MQTIVDLLRKTFNVEPKIKSSIVKVTVPEINKEQLKTLCNIADTMHVDDVLLKRSGVNITIIILT